MRNAHNQTPWKLPVEMQKDLDSVALELLQNYDKTQNNLNQTTFLISTGAILLSVNFIEKITRVSNMQSIGLLKYSWWFFVASLLTNILSQVITLISIHRINNKIRKLSYPFTSKLDKVFYLLYYFSLFLLFAGIFLLTYFASININAIVKL